MFRYILCCAVLLGIASTVATPARADGLDVDYDVLLSVIDEIQYAAAVANGVPLNQVIPLNGSDVDANGIVDNDQFAMLSAILMGNYTVNAQPFGTNQLNAATVTEIQNGFTANKNRIYTDMETTGLTCLTLSIGGVDCNLIELISADGNEAIGDTLKSLLAGYFTLGEPGISNYNGTGKDFIEVWFENFLTILTKGTEVEGVVSDINGNIDFNPSDYQRFGGAASNPAKNYLGASGDIDANVLGSALNLAEYTTGGGVRENWLDLCHITPPLRITTQPASGSTDTGRPYAFELAWTGGTVSLGGPAAQVKWEKLVPNVTGAQLVRDYSPEVPYVLEYPLQADDQNRFSASVKDSVWTRGSAGAVLAVNFILLQFLNQPESAVLNEGDDLFLSAQAIGGVAVPTYQWQKNEENLDFQTFSTLSIGAVTAADAGDYRCIVTGDNGTSGIPEIISDTASIAVDTPTEGEGTVEGEGTLEGEGEPQCQYNIIIPGCLSCTLYVDQTFGVSDGSTFSDTCGESHCYEAIDTPGYLFLS